MKKDLYHIEVTNRESFSEFLNLLHADFQENGRNWENNRLELFLEALQRYSEDLDGYYQNMHPDLDPDKATWRVFADILLGAIVYE